MNYPIITFIPESRFDERGRQLQFVESDVQRQERLAFLKASRKTKGESKDLWSSSSDYSSYPGSGRSSPTSSVRACSFMTSSKTSLDSLNPFFQIRSSRSSSSESGSPTHSPYSESRVLDITNSYPEPYLFYSSGPLPSPSSLSFYGSGSASSTSQYPTNTVFTPPGVTVNSIPSSSGFKRGHRRQSSSLHGLHAIPEED